MAKRVEVTVAGRTFTIKTADSPGKVQSAADLVQQKLDELRSSGGTAGTDRLMTLVALNLAGELLSSNQVDATSSPESLISALDDVVLQAERLATEAPALRE